MIDYRMYENFVIIKVSSRHNQKVVVKTEIATWFYLVKLARNLEADIVHFVDNVVF